MIPFISILNTKYYESLFKNLRVRKNDIMITKLSDNNFNVLNNEYHKIGSIFKKSILWILLRQKRNISLFKRSPRFMSGSEGSSLRDEE